MEALEPGDPRRVETAGRRYHLLARIGSGGMGVVYLGRSAGGRTVAVKMVHAEFAGSREFRDRFRREVEVARSVGGGFTAPVIDADPGARIPWLVSEFLPSVSVRDAVALWGPLPPAAVWRLASGIAEALVSIHRAGVVHRDLKPANVLLTADGPRVIDFGIARAVDAASLTRPGSRTGSPGFMSPEQVAGAPVGPAGDVFSLGSTLAYAATGDEPFGAGPWHEKMRRIQEEPPRLDGITDDRLRELIASCMDPDPSRRPTAARLSRELASAHQDDGPDGSFRLPPPVMAEIVKRRNEAENPPAPRERPHAVRPGRRTARRLGAVGVAAALIGVGLVAARSYGSGRSPADPPPTPTSTSAATPTITPSEAGYELVFSVTGDVRLTSLTYTVNDRPATLRNVGLPWRKTITLPLWPPRSSWRLAYRCPPGKVSYTVTISGNVVDAGGYSGNGRIGTEGHADGVY
ncbi:serine/threonine-protein kinase [Actinoallomurus acaciae]|uniref:Serine/threonine-protein kinase n=1 Tax=Actinoallomurus acaciae TaxID=502577 RepID=A0ABV5YMS1_9ACTN